jgi:hypothetical protein
LLLTPLAVIDSDGIRSQKKQKAGYKESAQNLFLLLSKWRVF